MEVVIYVLTAFQLGAIVAAGLYALLREEMLMLILVVLDIALGRIMMVALFVVVRPNAVIMIVVIMMVRLWMAISAFPESGSQLTNGQKSKLVPAVVVRVIRLHPPALVPLASVVVILVLFLMLLQ